MLAAGADRGHPAEAAHLHRRGAGGRCAGAELAVAVVAPAPPRAVRPQRQAVVGSTGDAGDPAESAHLHWRGTGGCGAVAELAKKVVAPGPGRAVRLQRQAVVLAAG